MTTNNYVKKYRLNESDQFNHSKFAVDFGNDFMSRLEVYKTFSSWNESYFWKLYDETQNKWDQINKKTVGQLPHKLWNYMRREIFIPILEQEFPRIKEFKDKVDTALIPELRLMIAERMNQLNPKEYTYHFFMDDVEIEWDHKYVQNALGELNYKPNYEYLSLEKRINQLNDYCVYYAFDELTHQLMKLAAAKARIQFKIRHEYEQQKANRKSKHDFDWWEFLSGNDYRKDKLVANEYLSYFQLLRLNMDEEITEKMVMTSFRQLSLIHHPDKGGNSEKFIELTEAKNKCIEFIKFK